MFKQFAPTSVTCVCIVGCALAYNVEAAPSWFFKGACQDSRVKHGAVTADLTVESSDKIHCDMAILSELKNGRILMQFHTGTGILGFAGPVLDRKTNQHYMAGIPIDKIYPIRDLGMTSSEILKRSGEGVLVGAEGLCLIDNKNLKLVKEIYCTSKYEADDKKTVYTVKINVSHVDKTDLGF